MCTEFQFRKMKKVLEIMIMIADEESSGDKQ